MLTPKNKALLKSLANKVEPSLSIGKGEVDDKVIEAISKALKAHELIKVRILPSGGVAGEVAQIIAAKSSSEVVSTIGHIVILYKKNEAHPLIVLG